MNQIQPENEHILDTDGSKEIDRSQADLTDHVHTAMKTNIPQLSWKRN